MNKQDPVIRYGINEPPAFKYGIREPDKGQKINMGHNPLLTDEEITRQAFQKGFNAAIKFVKQYIETLKQEHSHMTSYWVGYRAALDDLKSAYGNE